jgi:DNA-binding NtrC family response regulator
VRELQNVVVRAVILSRGGRLRFEALQPSAAPVSRDRGRGAVLHTEAELKRAARDAIEFALARPEGVSTGWAGRPRA